MSIERKREREIERERAMSHKYVYPEPCQTCMSNMYVTHVCHTRQVQRSSSTAASAWRANGRYSNDLFFNFFGIFCIRAISVYLLGCLICIQWVMSRICRMYMYLICCRSLSAKEPLVIGLFGGKWPVKMRHPMGRRHPVWVCTDKK